MPENECLFELSNTAPWAPGTEVNWNITTEKKANGLRHFATIEQFEAARTSEATPSISYSSPMSSRGPTLTIQDGTPLRMRLAQNLSSSEAQTGDRVEFEVLDEVKVENSVVIAGGATASATITDSQSKRTMGRAGRLDVSLDYVRSVFGEKIRVRGVQNNKAGGHVGAMTGAMVATAVVFWPAAPLFLFLKGKDVRIPKGHEVTVYVNGDQKVQGLPAAPTAVETSEKSAARPANTEKPMTDEDVLTLKAAGFGDDLIVSKIKAATPGFNLDTPDLVTLKQTGLSDAVIGAMVQAQGSPPATPASEPAPAVAVKAAEFGEPTFNDVFFGLDLSAGKLVSLERQTATIQGKAKFGGYGGIKLASEFKPGKSPVRFKSGQQPQFVVRSVAAAAPTVDPNTLYSLRTLTKNGDKRELVMTESHGPLGLGGATSNLAEGVLPVTFEKFGEHSQKIVPEKFLPPGEYTLSRRAGMIDLFCFGVD